MATILRTTLPLTDSAAKHDALRAFIEQHPGLTVTTVSSLSFDVSWGGSRKMRFTVGGNITTNCLNAAGSAVIASHTGSINSDTLPNLDCDMYYDDSAVIINVGRNKSLTGFVGAFFIKDVDGDGSVYTSWKSTTTTTIPRHMTLSDLRMPDADSPTAALTGGISNLGRLSDGKFIFVPLFIYNGDAAGTTTKAIPRFYIVSSMPGDITGADCTEFYADSKLHLNISGSRVWDVS